MSRLNNYGRWIYGLPGSLQTYLTKRPGASLFAANSLWLLFDKLIRLVLALTVGAWVARNLGPHAFGELAYAITFIALFQGVANLGLDGIVVRDLARNPGQAALILGTAFRLRLLAGLLCWLIAIGSIWVLRHDDNTALQMVALIGVSLVFQSADTVDLWFQCQGKNSRTVAAKLASYAIANSARIAFIVLDAPLWMYALATLLDAVLLAIALAGIYRRFPTAQRWYFNLHISKELLSQSWPFMLSGLAALLYMRIDQIMIREMLDETQLGFYSAAVSLSQIWNVIPITLATALAPYIARKKLDNEDAYMRAIFLMFRVFAALSTAIALTVALLSGVIIELMYGSRYAASAHVLTIHIFSNIFIFMGVAQGLWLINEGRGKLTLYRTALGAIVSIVGNFLLIPKVGIQGSAFITVLAQFFSVVASNAFFAPEILKLQLQAFWPTRRRTPSA
nr:flippase [uncultured Albidiferax sp.]